MSIMAFLKNRRMIQALRDRKMRVALFLIQKGADVNKADPNDGWTPLTYAAVYGDDRATKALLNMKADVNKTDHRGMTPIMRAVEFHHDDVFQTLMSNPNTDLNARDESGWNVLVWGLRCMNESVVSCILKDKRFDMPPVVYREALDFVYQFQRDYFRKEAYRDLIQLLHEAKRKRPKQWCVSNQRPMVPPQNEGGRCRED